MEEIKVGDYVRTDRGLIRKVKTIHSEEDREKQKGFSKIKGILINGNIKISDIVNHSKNITDLIEIGDYVNGSEVVTVYGYDEDGNDRDDRGIIEVDDDYAYRVYLEDIKIFSIVTKEQFANMEYRLEV